MKPKLFSLSLLFFLLLLGTFLSVNYHILFDSYEYTHWDAYNYLLTLKNNIENFNDGIVASGWMPYRQMGEHQYFELVHGINLIYQFIGIAIYKIIHFFAPSYTDFYSIYFLQQTFLYFFIYVLGMFFLINRNISNRSIRILCYILSVFGTHYVTMFHSFQFGALFHPFLCLFLLELKSSRFPKKYAITGAVLSFFLCITHDHSNSLVTFVILFMVCHFITKILNTNLRQVPSKIFSFLKPWHLTIGIVLIAVGIIAPLIYLAIQYGSNELQLLSGKIPKNYYQVTSNDPAYFISLPNLLKHLFFRPLYGTVDFDQAAAYLYYGNLLSLALLPFITIIKRKWLPLLLTIILIILVPTYIPFINPIKLIVSYINPFFNFGSRHINSILIYAAPLLILWIGLSFEKILSTSFSLKKRLSLLAALSFTTIIYLNLQYSKENQAYLYLTLFNIVVILFLGWSKPKMRPYIMPIIIAAVFVELVSLYYNENFVADGHHHDMAYRTKSKSPAYQEIDNIYMNINMPMTHSFSYRFSKYLAAANNDFGHSRFFYHVIPGYHFFDPYSFTETFSDFYHSFNEIYPNLNNRILLTSSVIITNDQNAITERIFSSGLEKKVSSLGHLPRNTLEKLKRNGITIIDDLKNVSTKYPEHRPIREELIISGKDFILYKQLPNIKIYKTKLPLSFPKYLNTNIFNSDYNDIAVKIGNKVLSPTYFDNFKQSYQFQVSYQDERELILSLDNSQKLNGKISIEWRDRFLEHGILIKHFDSENLILETNFTHPGFLTYMDRNAPEWRATIDNVEKQIITSNSLFKGLLVPEGKHIIHFHYSDTIRKFYVWWAILTQLIGILITFNLAIRLYRRN